MFTYSSEFSDANLNTQCKNDKPDCKQGCRFKSGQSGPVECFCNDGFSLGTDDKSCDGKGLKTSRCCSGNNIHKCVLILQCNKTGFLVLLFNLELVALGGNLDKSG